MIAHWENKEIWWLIIFIYREYYKLLSFTKNPFEFLRKAYAVLDTLPPLLLTLDKIILKFILCLATVCDPYSCYPISSFPCFQKYKVVIQLCSNTYTYDGTQKGDKGNSMMYAYIATICL